MSGYSIPLISDPARGTSQLYLRLTWTSAFKQFLLFYGSPLSLSFTYLKLFFIYTVRSVHFIPSPCFIPSLQFMVHSGQYTFYTDRIANIA